MEDPMNRSSIIALVIGALLFGCGAGMVASEVLESEAVAWEGQGWEYFIEREIVTGGTQDQFDEYGEQGWELVTHDSNLFIFKRPLP